MLKGKIIAVFNSNYKAVLDELLLEVPGASHGKMFGYPAYYAEQKLSICSNVGQTRKKSGFVPPLQERSDSQNEWLF